MREILTQFQDKIKGNLLTENDFVDKSFFTMFYDKYSDPFIKKIADCMNPVYEQGEDKYIYHISLNDEWEVRIDFIYKDNVYKLAHLDSYTLPLKKIDRLPFTNFESLPFEIEAKMREEYRITKIVNDFIRLKNIIGKEEALNWFKDGQSEKTGVPAWMPYFTKRKAFIAYSAWMQDRLYGENVSIREFTETHSELFFKECIWIFLYKVASHLKCMISYDEYIEIFETIWKDRAVCNGYQVDILYSDCDVLMTFTAI